MALQLVIHGAGGRMGREVARAALTDPDWTVVAGVEQYGHPAVGRDIGTLCGLDEAGVRVVAAPAQLPPSAVTVDFSTPSAATALVDVLCSGSAGIVIGTTGFSKEQQEHIVEAAHSVPVLTSPNMSIGVNLLYQLVELAARRLSRRYDVEIVEAHHRYKKDAPSGTARQLGEIVAAVRELDYESAAVHGRRGSRGERSDAEIGIHAVRGGDIVGDHIVMFAGDGERLELRHVAHSRAIFARGALVAAKWLVGRQPGLYTMAHVLDAGSGCEAAQRR